VIDKIVKGNLVYDFTFANLVVAYLETNDYEYLHKIAELDAANHILNHAKHFKYNVPQESKLELVAYLLSPIDKNKEKLPEFKKNLEFAIKNIAKNDFAQTIALQFLPEKFCFSSSMFFTFGYDIGVVYGNNCSLNLAHPLFVENISELKYYAVHELHHAGFIMMKDNKIPSLNITSFKEMTQLIEYLTHLEGMGTYAPLDIRIKENATNLDRDYIALLNMELMESYKSEYFDIYYFFKNSPKKILGNEDWSKINILSDVKRLWYTVRAIMAKTIDEEFGRNKLVSLISEPSSNFIETYLSIS